MYGHAVMWYPLKFLLQNILPIHWHVCILFTGENLRVLKIKSSWEFLKHHPHPQLLNFLFLFPKDNTLSVLYYLIGKGFL